MKRELNRTELDFVTDTNEAILRGMPLKFHLILWSAVIFFIVGIGWASFAKLDEVTTGEGKVIPSSDIQVIQNLEGGIVKEIKVSIGDVVGKGQVLMLIDDTRFSSTVRETEVKQRTLEAKIARLKAESIDEVPRFPSSMVRKFKEIINSERLLYNSRKKEYEVRINILKDELIQKEQQLLELKSRQTQLDRSLQLVKKELELTRPLVKQGAVSQVEVLRLERTVNDMQGELDGNKIAVPRAEAAVAGAKRQIEEYKLGVKTKVVQELNDAKAEFNGLKEAGTALEDRVNRTTVRSPVVGTVNQVNVTTIGGIIQPGEDLLEIVPLEDTLLIEARIRPSDIGFLRPGLKAMVKLTAYDFAIYGGLEAKLEHISADTITDERGDSYYEIRVRTKSNFLGSSDKPLPIIPGMRATVDILTGEKTVLDYILKPILKTKQKALRER